MSDPIRELHPPPAFLDIARTLESRGFEAWAVGGAVRDEVLGRLQPDQDSTKAARADWDLATNARPDQVRAVFRRTIPIGVEHGTVGVLGGDETMYEVTTFRLDVETDGRHAVVEFADRIDDDLARRDFTINALAWRPATDELRDPFSGIRDLEQRVLRAVGEPAERFAEDYLRVLRGLRFAGCLGLQIESRTRAALYDAAGHLQRLSAERVREELMKVMADATPSASLSLYAEVGALQPWYAEMAAAAADPRWEITLAGVDLIPATRVLLRLARWLIATAEEGETRAEKGGELVGRLRFSNADTRRVVHLLRHYPPILSPVDSAAELRQWLADTGAETVRDLYRLAFAEARAAGATERGRYLVATWRRVHAELLQRPPLRLTDLAIGGDELLGLGVARGPAIGILLDELHAEVLEDPDLNEREALLTRAQELIELGHLAK